MTSDELVKQLKPFGLVNLFQGANGWSAKCNLFVSGMTAEVRSDFAHPTMLSALIQLRENVTKVASGIVTYAHQIDNSKALLEKIDG